MTKSRGQEVSESLAKVKAQVNWLCLVYQNEMKGQDWFEKSEYSDAFKHWLSKTAMNSALTDLTWDLMLLEGTRKQLDKLEQGSD